MVNQSNQSKTWELPTETLSPDFVDTSVVRLPEYRLRRFSHRGKRFYYLYDEATEKVSIYPSTTTITSTTMPKDRGLEDWRASMGVGAANDYMNSRADFGTFLHILASRYLRGEKIVATDINKAPLLEEFRLYASVECGRSTKWADDNYEELITGFVAFVKFCKEYEVEPIFIEGQLKDDEMGAAGTLDLVARLSFVEWGFFGEEYKRSGKRTDKDTGEVITYQKGDPKLSRGKVKHLVYVDFKSGKSLQSAHIAQCEINRRLWNKNFPELSISDAYVWHPKDFARNRSANFALNHASGRESVLELIDDYLSIMKKKAKRALTSPAQTVFSGDFLIGNNEEIDMKTLTLEEAILQEAKANSFSVEAAIEEVGNGILNDTLTLFENA